MNNHTPNRFSLASALRRDDQGIALPMVLLIFIVGVALIGAFLVAIVGSANVSHTTRAAIQAQAAAEAGIAAQIAKIGSGNPCTASGISKTVSEPIFEVEVDASKCNEASDARLRLTAYGEAPDGSSAVVEAVFAVTPGQSASPSTPMSSASLYIAAGTSDGGSLEGLQVSSSSDPAPPIIVARGDFKCEGSKFIAPGDLIVADGSATFNSGNCEVYGNVYVNGDVVTGWNNLFGGNINSGGNLTVQSTIGYPPNYGDVAALGNVTIHDNGTVGNVSAGGNLDNEGKVYGSAKVSGSLVPTDGMFASPPTIGAPAPNVNLYTPENIPSWVNYSYSASDWPTSTWKHLSWSATECTQFSQAASHWDTITQDGMNTFIDATNCPSGFSTSGWGAAQIRLRADLAIMMNKGEFKQGAKVTSADGKPHSLFVFTPDADPTSPQANCPTNGGQIIFNAFEVVEPVSISLYTPCGVILRNTHLHGGVFVNGVQMEWGVSTIDTKPFYLPGADFGADGPIDHENSSDPVEATDPKLTMGAGGAPPQPVSVRNIAD